MEEQAIKTPEERANEVITEAHMMLGTLCSLARFDTEVEVTLKQFRERLEVVWGLSATATLSNGLKELQMANMIVVEPQKKRRVTQVSAATAENDVFFDVTQSRLDWTKWLALRPSMRSCWQRAIL